MTTNWLDESVHEHIAHGREFYRKALDYLSAGDLHQASEKGWGAASPFVKAAARKLDLPYDHHSQFNRVVGAAAEHVTYDVVTLARAAHMLHSHFYERMSLIDANAVERELRDVGDFMNGIQPIFNLQREEQ